MTLIIITAIQASPLVLGEIIYDDHAVSFSFLLFSCSFIIGFLSFHICGVWSTDGHDLFAGWVYLSMFDGMVTGRIESYLNLTLNLFFFSLFFFGHFCFPATYLRAKFCYC